MQDRDLIACHVLNGILIAKIIGLGWEYDGDPAYRKDKKTNAKMLAEASYKIADALLKTKEPPCPKKS